MKDEHNSPQWYGQNIRLHSFALGFFQKTSYQWREYSLIINSWSFSKLVDVGLLSNNKN